MTPKEFIDKIESGEAKVLTLDDARSIIGKPVYWMYFGDPANYLRVDEMTIGKIMVEKDYFIEVEGKVKAHPEFENRYEFLKKKMPYRAKESEKRIILLDKENNPLHISCDPEESFFDKPTFTCSDADREVYYIMK